MSILVNTSWTDFKTLARKKNIAVQEQHERNSVHLFLVEENIAWRCILFKEGIAGHDAQEFDDYLASKSMLRIGEAITPRSTDGKTVVQPQVTSGNLQQQFTSFADSATALWEGPQARVYLEPGEPDYVHEMVFRDWVQLFDSEILFMGAEMSRDDCDWLSAGARIEPAGITEVAPGTGNAIVMNGIAIPVPAGGTHNVDPTVANFMPAPDKTGFWNWDWPDTGHGELSPSYTQNGEFHVPAMTINTLFAKSYIIGRGVKKFSVPNVQPGYLFPGWIMVSGVHKIATGSEPLRVAMEIRVMRKSVI